MQIYKKKRKRLHKKGSQIPKDWLGIPTWPSFHCFGTPIWQEWRHVKTLYIKIANTVMWFLLPTQSGIWSLGFQAPVLSHCQKSALVLYNWLPLLHVTVQKLVPPNELHVLVPPTGPSGSEHFGPMARISHIKNWVTYFLYSSRLVLISFTKQSENLFV